MKSALSHILFRLIYDGGPHSAPSRPRRLLCDALFRILGHRICCRVPEWTAYVGQRWDTYDVAPWNLYNLLWAVGARVREGMTP